MSFLKDESFSTVSVEIAPMLKNTPATDPELFFFLTYLLNFERLCCISGHKSYFDCVEWFYELAGRGKSQV